MKKDYEAPKLTALGSFETLTQAAVSGTVTDATFSNNTPQSQLTFS